MQGRKNRCVGIVAQIAQRHAPVPEHAAPRCAFHHQLEVAMPGITLDLVLQGEQCLALAFHHLHKITFAIHETAGDAGGAIRRLRMLDQGSEFCRRNRPCCPADINQKMQQRETARNEIGGLTIDGVDKHRFFQRTMEEIALNQVAAIRAKLTQLGAGFNPFGHQL